MTGDSEMIGMSDNYSCSKGCSYISTRAEFKISPGHSMDCTVKQVTAKGKIQVNKGRAQHQGITERRKPSSDQEGVQARPIKYNG